MSETLFLKPGDVVAYLGEDWVVERQTVYSSPALSWAEWELNPGSLTRRATLVALEGAFYTGEPVGPPEAATESLELAGGSFRLQRRGRADVRIATATGPGAFDRAEFRLYRSDDGRLVLYRKSRHGEQTVALVPESPASLDVYGA